MKTITFTLALLISIGSFANTSAFNKAMETALGQFKEAKTQDDLQNTANTFKRISNTAPQEWLPEYYQAQCYIYISFREKEASKRDAYLDIAEKSIQHILELEPENSEAYALQGFMYTARLVVDPMTRGREYSILSMGAIKKALALNPTNPRALYLELSNEVGSAKFFGSDTTIYCERINNLIENWDTYNQSPALHPTWGKGQIQGMAGNCQPQSDSTTSK